MTRSLNEVFIEVFFFLGLFALLFIAISSSSEERGLHEKGYPTPKLSSLQSSHGIAKPAELE
jgi:hypothetical protein